MSAIQAEGITRGEIPFSANRVMDGVWLTTDRDPGAHGLSGGEVTTYSQEMVRNLKRQGVFSQDFPDRAVELGSLNKRAVRFTVRIPSTDKALHPWMKWGRKHLDTNWFEKLNQTGGGKRKAETWFLCLRPVTLEEIVSVDVLAPPSDGDFAD